MNNLSIENPFSTRKYRVNKIAEDEVKFKTFFYFGYESCQLGKHVSHFFPDNLNKQALSHFPLVHFDI